MLRCASFCLGILAACSGAFCQTSLDESPRIPVPESSFVSLTQYTNAFFGFRLSLPDKHHFQVVDLSESNKALQHYLFAQKSGDHGISLLIVTATQVLGNPDEEAQKVVFLHGEQGAKGPEGLDIGGRLFWRNHTEEKTYAGKVYRYRYATALRGFVIVFMISTQDGRIAEDLRQDVESIKFFDPATAKEVAGPDSHPYVTEAVHHRLENTPQLDLAQLVPGKIKGNLYSNDSLGFSYQFPRDWHASDNVGDELLTEKSKSKTPTNSALNQDPGLVAQCTRVLSSATKYPSEKSDGSFNPHILILAADPGCFAPDAKFPDSVHDDESIQLLGQALVRSFAGTVFLGRDASRLLAADLDGHIFLEMPSGNAVPVPGTTLLRKVHMAFVLTSLRQYWVIWLMESDTESELSRLMKTAISFDPPRQTAMPQPH
jgi:hypothetical protein